MADPIPGDDPAIDPPADPIDPPADPPSDPPADPKDNNRAAYDARQLKKQLDELRKENEGYRRRDEEARKEKLTAEQKLQEERDRLAQENQQLRADSLRQKVAAEFKLPSALAGRLIGSDEESMRADAEELSKIIPKSKLGNPTDPARGANSGARIYKRSELQADVKLASSPEVKQAFLDGRIIDG